MAAQDTTGNREELRDKAGNVVGYRTKFSNVSLEAVQTTELHRTLETDHTVTEQELPGLIDVYLVIDGGRARLDQFKAPVVLEAIQAAKKKQEQPAPVEPDQG